MNADLKLSREESAAIERLLASQIIGRAPRVQAVLSYLLDRLREGRIEEINESRIGEAVFGRPAGYNPSEDNIVRVTVRHLRDRLDRYYETEGAAEQWVVTIPKGKYVPVIKTREVRSLLIVEGEQHLSTEVSPGPDSPTSAFRSPFLQARVQVTLAILLLGNIIWVYQNFTYGQHMFGHTSDTGGGLLGQLFADSNQQLSIIGSDSGLQAYRQVFQHIVPLQSYLDRSYLRQPAPTEGTPDERIWNFIGGRKDTTMSSARVAANLQKALAFRFVNLRHPRDCTIRDFEHQDAILLGGPWINPWAQLFEDRLNFRIVPPPSNASGSEIVNMKPRPNEAGVYRTHRDGAYSVSYVRLAMIADRKNGAKTMLVGASSEESLEAGGAFLVGNDAAGELLDFAHSKAISMLSPFEVVLEVRGLESAPRGVKIVAYRTVTD